MRKTKTIKEIISGAFDDQDRRRAKFLLEPIVIGLSASGGVGLYALVLSFFTDLEILFSVFIFMTIHFIFLLAYINQLFFIIKRQKIKIRVLEGV